MHASSCVHCIPQLTRRPSTILPEAEDAQTLWDVAARGFLPARDGLLVTFPEAPTETVSGIAIAATEEPLIAAVSEAFWMDFCFHLKPLGLTVFNISGHIF